MAGLTEKQEEILRILQEECGEVVQMVSKVCRFGIDQQHLKDDKPNRLRLAEEIGDLQCMIKLAILYNIVSAEEVDAAMRAKLDKLHVWSNIFKEQYGM